MGLFGQSSPFDADVEKATSDTNTTENWSLILDVCDKVSSNPRNAKDCLKAILKRMGHTDPHVVMQAIVLLDACVNNCGKPFHLEIASREFENEFRRLLSKAQTQVSVKMRAVLKNWAENDFRSDPELNLIHALYIRLRQEGVDFSNLGDKPAKSNAKTSLPKDPNVVTSQEEEDAIAKAIELSLKETKSSPKNQVSSGGGSSATNTNNSSSAYPSLYPSFSNSGGGGGGSSNASPAISASASAPQAQAEPRKVRALYDFEAAEENELTFFTGEILHVTDDSDQNWWKGFNQRGEGLFPSNFVTADLSVDPKRLDINQHQTNNVQFNNEIDELQQKTDAAIAAAADANQRIEIDESKIDRLLHLLHEANPEDPSQDSDEMLRLEQEVHQMGPLIDAELERVDRKHAQLTQLSSDLVDAINLYHSLMRDDRNALLGGTAGGLGASYLPGGMPVSGVMQMPPGGGLNGLASLAYQASMPSTQMLYGAAGYAAGNTAVAGSFPLQLSHTQNYGMSSLPYSANMPPANGMPPTTAPTTHNSSMNAGATGAVTNAFPAAPQQIPMQFQNGHMHAGQQLNGVSGQHQMNSTLATATMQQQLQHQQQLPPQTNPANFSMLQQQQQYAPTTTAINTDIQQQQPTMMPAQSTQVLQQQQQQPQPQQFMSPQHNAQQQQQQQQHIPYMPQQYAAVSLPNGHQNTQYANMPMGGITTTTADPGTGILQQQLPNQSLAQQSTVQLNNQTSHMDQFSQMQQQMAAMSLQMGGVAGGGIGNQGITQSFLNQNEAKQNIPIYQQQR